MANNQNTEMEKIKIPLVELNKEPRGEAWKKARELEDKEIIKHTSPEGFYNIVSQLDDVRDKALIITAYFTAGRIEEIVKYQRIKWGKKKAIIINKRGKKRKGFIQDWTKREKIGELKDGLMKKDIKEEVINGISCIVFRIRNLKNLNPKEKVKWLPVRLDKKYNQELWKILKLYIDTIDYDYQEIFPFGKRNAERIINKINWNPHSLRKLRLTHLVKYENYSEQKLKLYAGWTDTRPSTHYIKLGYEDLI